jgi:hypothetical protein
MINIKEAYVRAYAEYASPPANTTVKKMWIYTSTPPTCLHGIQLNKLSTGATLHLPLRFIMNQYCRKSIFPDNFCGSIFQF